MFTSQDTSVISSLHLQRTRPPLQVWRFSHSETRLPLDPTFKVKHPKQKSKNASRHTNTNYNNICKPNHRPENLTKHHKNGLSRSPRRQGVGQATTHRLRRRGRPHRRTRRRRVPQRRLCRHARATPATTPRRAQPCQDPERGLVRHLSGDQRREAADGNHHRQQVLRRALYETRLQPLPDHGREAQADCREALRDPYSEHQC